IGSAMRFRYRLGRWPRTRGVLTFNDRLHLYKTDRSYKAMPEYVDKIRAKEIAGKILGNDWLIPTLYSGENLPPVKVRTWDRPYVIKTNNSSGTNIFVTDPLKADWDAIEKKLASWLRHGHKKSKNEWPYHL